MLAEFDQAYNGLNGEEAVRSQGIGEVNLGKGKKKKTIVKQRVCMSKAVK